MDGSFLYNILRIKFIHEALKGEYRCAAQICLKWIEFWVILAAIQTDENVTRITATQME